MTSEKIKALSWIPDRVRHDNWGLDTTPRRYDCKMGMTAVVLAHVFVEKGSNGIQYRYRQFVENLVLEC